MEAVATKTRSQMVMQCIHSQEAEELGYDLKTPPSVVPPS